MMHKFAISSLATVTATLLILGMSAEANAGRFCGESVASGEASGKTEDEASKAAIIWWSSRAGALGRGYEVWDDANDKSLACHPGVQSTFKCIAKAKPCLRDGLLPDNVPKRDL